MGLVNKEVLVIDDDKDICEVVRRILDNIGMRVFTASSVRAAMATLAKRVPHLIILDLNMPEETGFQFLEKRRLSATLARVPVMVLSSRKDRAAVYQAVSLGASDYMAKPVKTGFLLQKVRRLFSVQGDDTPVVSFSPSARVRATVTVPGRILRAHELGFIVEAPFKIIDRARVKVRSPLLEQLGTDVMPTRMSSRLPIPSADAPGQYQSEFFYVGMSERQATRLRKVIRSWSGTRVRT